MTAPPVGREGAEVITKYYRPTTLDEAVALAGRPDAVILAGGTSVNADPSLSAAIAVDLQAVGLADISSEPGIVRLGAMTTLQAVVDADEVPAVLRDLARREAPQIIRNAATVGGTIGIADFESPFLTGLLAHDAEVTLEGGDATIVRGLDDLLDDPTALDGTVITSVAVPTTGTAATDDTARTPMDRPIVLAVGRRAANGEMRLAIAGVADRPVIVDPDRVAALDPPSDFRGSSEYRRSIASVLAQRVLGRVGGRTGRGQT